MTIINLITVPAYRIATQNNDLQFEKARMAQSFVKRGINRIHKRFELQNHNF